jgi:SatD family protein
MTTEYVALIADVTASRTLSARARAALQNDIRAAARALNARYRKHLAARFAVTLGDELQGLFTSAAPTPVWEVSHDLRARFPATEWVVACGRGGLTTAIRPGVTAPELDGPCFHAARRALEDAKRQGLVLAFAGFTPAVTACSAYYAALYRGWTARQRIVATAQRANPGARLDELSRLLHVGPSAISHLRTRMAWPLVAAGDKVFQDLLSQ